MASTAAAPAAPVAAGPRARPRPRRRRRLLLVIAERSLLITLAICFLAPFAFILLTSLMSDHQALSTDLWPHPFEPQNFVKVFEEEPVAHYALNSFMYASLATIGMLVSSIPAAYALSVLKWRGRSVVMVLVLTAMMLPEQVTIIPVYVLFSKLHLVGTLWPLIVPNWLGDAFSIFLLRQFFLTIPSEYADAARIDGCGELRVLTSVYLRLAKPAIAAVSLFLFFACWNDFFGPLIYTGETPAHWTLSLGLSQFRTVHHVEWNLTMAATLLFMAPVIAVFFAAQKVFIEGVTLSGVKG
jgi:multiple sugar transport system permease protein